AFRQTDTVIPSDRSLQIYELEYNKKFAIPAAGFFFTLLAFPLGLGTKRAGRTAGFGLALLLSTLYWALLFAGQSAGIRSSVSPGLAMWAPNGLVLLSAIVVWIARRKSGRRSV
ncbi:MAG: LptF/LptG family permease, partial [Spirochaetales bacterium]